MTKVIKSLKKTLISAKKAKEDKPTLSGDRVAIFDEKLASKLRTKNIGEDAGRLYYLNLYEACALVEEDKLKVYDKGKEIQKDGKLWFYVTDTGRGIPKDRHEAIFDRFVQADLELSRGYEGSGIGLSIVKAYVEALNGSLELKSIPGKGSTFRFCIPYIPAKEHAEEKESSIVSPKETGDFTILINEDEVVNYQLLEAILSKDYKLLFAKDGTEAIATFKDHPEISLILMDIKLPGEFSGLDTTRKIRELNQQVPVIAVTAYATTSDRNKALKAGCNDYLSKPYKEENLQGLIRKHLKID